MHPAATAILEILKSIKQELSMIISLCTTSRNIPDIKARAGSIKSQLDLIESGLSKEENENSH